MIKPLFLILSMWSVLNLTYMLLKICFWVIDGLGRKSYSIDKNVSVDDARFFLSLYCHIEDIDEWNIMKLAFIYLIKSLDLDFLWVYCQLVIGKKIIWRWSVEVYQFFLILCISQIFLLSRARLFIVGLK